MNERNLEIVLDALAENIRNLRLEVMILEDRVKSTKCDNERLVQENERLKEDMKNA
jgi:hypothetical protein